MSDLRTDYFRTFVHDLLAFKCDILIILLLLLLMLAQSMTGNKTSKKSRSNDRGTQMIDTADISKSPLPLTHKKTSHPQPVITTLLANALSAPPLPNPAPTPPPMHHPRTIPLLICSIGNPGSAYAHTLHSAGHTLLSQLQSHLEYPAFRKNRALGNGLVSESPAGGSPWTLWQSTSLMNVSGKGVKAAYTNWSQSLPAVEDEAVVEGASPQQKSAKGRLVVVHDELERPFGTVRVNTRQGASAKGHNGLKSIGAAMGGTEWTRIGIGIGRPESRESRDVANFVMRKMTSEERTQIESCVGELIDSLRALEKG